MTTAQDSGDHDATPDARALAPFFAAARGARPATLDDRLFAAILADAAAVSAERAAPARRPVRRAWAEAVAGWLEGFGGWRGAAAMLGCAALGFWLGLAGPADRLAEAADWSGTTASLEAFEDPVTALYDAALEEG